MSADVDAAREASPMLQEWVRTGQWPPSPEPPGGWTPPRLYEAIYREVEAAVRAECETAEGRLLDEALSTLRAGGLDDETLGHALHSTYHPVHPWSGCYNPEVVYGVWLPRFRAAIDALREGADKV